MEPVVLITGASSGIGAALVRHLLRQRRFRIVATTHHQAFSMLQQRFPPSPYLLCLPLDVAQHSTHRAVIDHIMHHWGQIDILVNNAAIAFRSVVEDMSYEEEQYQFAVNYFGPMNLIRLVLPIMRKQRRGKIINISSVSGMMAMPTMAPYSAAKFALEGASEALWYEVRPWNISVTLVQPGFVHSEAFRKVRFPKKFTHSTNHPYWKEYDNMGKFINRLMERAVATPESVARIIYRIIRARRPPLRVPATPDAWLFILFRRLLPRRLYHWILYNQLPYIRNQ